MKTEEIIVISLGGSLIVPDTIDTGFLKDFKKLILSEVKKGKKFIIITGGGKICRRYQEAAKEVSSSSDYDLDLIGIASLKLNAELLRVVFGDQAYGEVILNMNTSLSLEKPIIVGAAYKPGSSTDLDAIWAAKSVGAKRVINLSNTDYVYDSDPKTNPDAKKIEKISWADYRDLIPKVWNPGLSSPFDPIASELAEKENITVITMNGRPIENLAKCLGREEFMGTTIS
ncbi:MAG: UMP kinase [Minisyncoccia bacterium]